MELDDLVARSGDLKRELVEYGRRPRFQREFREALLADDVPASLLAREEGMTELFDQFLLRHVVEPFVASRTDLTDAEREMLLGWHDAIEGIFEVRRRDGKALIVINLIDDLEYRVRSNMGTSVFRQMPRRSYLRTRLVPIGEEWLISGVSSVLPASYRDHMHRVAAETAIRQPALVFRNPEKLAQAWELQRAERERFVRFFGTDLVVLAGGEIEEQMRLYQDFSRKEILATLPEPERASRAATPAPVFAPDPHLVESEKAAIIFDEVEGLNFYADFGLVEATFADPALLRRRMHKMRLIDYLDDDSVSPLVFRRLAARDFGQASLLFRKLLRRPDFDWERDGEALLRERKPQHFERPSLPSVTPISDRLRRYVSGR